MRKILKTSVLVAGLFITGVTVLASDTATTKPAVATTQVAIDNFSFSPAEVTVCVGTQVTWTNHDDVIHTATSDAKPALFNTGVLDTDQSASYVFDKPGTYTYYCKVHPHMTGKVVVTATK